LSVFFVRPSAGLRCFVFHGFSLLTVYTNYTILYCVSQVDYLEKLTRLASIAMLFSLISHAMSCVKIL
jgi:hypothetical protein